MSRFARTKTSSLQFADVAVAAGLAVVAIVLGLRFSEIGFLGWDAYPILAAAGPGSADGLLGVIGRPLADGLLPMSFYRPLLSLSVALEWPLWGPAAGGYAAVNAALFGLCGLVLHVLLRRFGATRQMALAAVLFFILHPVVPDVVPYLPRRPELLCTLFVLLALQLDHRGRFDPSRASIAGAWLATVAAAGSKETAIVLPILIAAARWLFPAPGRPLLQAARGFAAHGVVLAAALLLRLLTLGGLGGYPDSDVTQLPGLWLRTLAKTLLGVFLPGGVLPSIGFASLALGVAFMVVQPGRGSVTSWRAALRARLGPHHLRPGAFAALWILTFATVYAAAARLSPWYLLIVVCGAATGFGLMLDLAFSTIRSNAPGRSAATAALLGGVLLLASFAAGSPLFRPLEEFQHASRDCAAFLGELEERIRQAPAGRIEAGPYPRLTIGAGGRQVPVLVPRSLPAWARIVFPQRHIVFVSRGEYFTFAPLRGDVAEPVPAGVTVVVLGGGIHKSTASDESTP